MNTRQYVCPALLAALMLPAAAMAQQATANLEVSITIVDGCLINAATLAFAPQIVGVTSVVDDAASVTLNCTAGTDYELGFGLGQYANGTQRRMQDSGTNYVNYQIYTAAERTTILGEVGGGNTITGQGTGSAATVSVYGRVPGGQTVVAGSYTDQVLMTLQY